MRPEISEFSPERDPALGAALRAALDRPDDAAFLAAVLERARRARPLARRPRRVWRRTAVRAAGRAFVPQARAGPDAGAGGLGTRGLRAAPAADGSAVARHAPALRFTAGGGRQ